MYDSASQTMAAGQNPDRPLDRISHAVNRVNSSVVRVSAFLARFNGAEPPAPPSGEQGAVLGNPPYRIGMDQLFAALERLENRIDSLETLG